MFELKDKDGNVVAKIQAESPGQLECKSGIWLTLQTDDGTEPTICIVKTGTGGWYLGFYRDSKSSPVACDLAVTFDKKDGPLLQVAKGNEIETVSLMSFIKDFTHKTGG